MNPARRHNELRGLPVGERLLAQIEFDPNGGCWLWTGAINSRGYGTLWHDNRNTLAHRISFELATGQSAARKEVLHRCDLPGCVNPEHLSLGTHAENMADMKAKGRSNTARGSKAKSAKLNEAKVAEIKSLLLRGVSCRRLAARYGIARSGIHAINRGRQWAHVPWPTDQANPLFGGKE